jgi:hypothetical protein
MISALAPVVKYAYALPTACDDCALALTGKRTLK